MKSNEAIFVARQNLIREFKKYEYIIVPFVRFIITFSALRMLIDITSYTGTFSNVLPILFIALIGAFVSAEWILVGAILLASLFVFSANPILGIVIFILLGILYLAFMRVFPKESLLILATLIAFSINMEMILPIVAALLGSYVCIVAILLGVILWFVLPQLAGVIQSTAINKSEILDVITSISKIDFKAMLLDEKMLATIVVFFIVFSVVYLIRKQSIDYAPYIAIGVGAVMNILGFLLANIFFTTLDSEVINIVIWTIIFSCVAVIIQFLSIALDYQRAEVVAFEDDDNYYYVKVVPKIKMNTVENSVKHIYTNTPQKRKGSEGASNEIEHIASKNIGDELRSKESSRQSSIIKADESLRQNSTLGSNELFRQSSTIKADESLRQSSTLRPNEPFRQNSTLRSNEPFRQNSTLRSNEPFRQNSTLRSNEPFRQNSTLRSNEPFRQNNTLRANEPLKQSSTVRPNSTIRTSESLRQNSTVRQNEFLKQSSTLGSDEFARTYGTSRNNTLSKSYDTSKLDDREKKKESVRDYTSLFMEPNNKDTSI